MNEATPLFLFFRRCTPTSLMRTFIGLLLGYKEEKLIERLNDRHLVSFIDSLDKDNQDFQNQDDIAFLVHYYLHLHLAYRFHHQFSEWGLRGMLFASSFLCFISNISLERLLFLDFNQLLGVVMSEPSVESRISFRFITKQTYVIKL